MSFFQSTIKRGLISIRVVTRQRGDPPSFIIVGAQKGGTTSLYHYLAQHPKVARALWKETHFFDLNYQRGMEWYLSHFPRVRRSYGGPTGRLITGEASPYYLFHPHVPARVRALLPDVRLLVLLRNPVDRAYSHYHHEVVRGIETLSFEEATIQEEARLAGEQIKMRRNPHYYSLPHQRYSYLARGLYLEQLERWTHYFPREQLLILQSEALYRDPEAVLRSVHEFLGLPPLELGRYRKTYVGNYPKIDSATRKRLHSFFKPHNKRLYKFLDTDFGWDNF